MSTNKLYMIYLDKERDVIIHEMKNSFTVPNISHFVFDFFKEKFGVK